MFSQFASHVGHVARHGALRVVGVCIAAFVVSQAQAARPMAIDDADLVDAQACQLESWVQANRGSTEFWAQPACNFTGNVEWALGGAVTRDEGRARTTDLVLQGKTLFKPLERNGWGVGLAAGTVHHPQLDKGARDWYAHVPASFSFHDDALIVHANLGWQRDGQARRHEMTWGLGAQVQLYEGLSVTAETFGQNRGKPYYQFGISYWLVPDRLQVDASYGDRTGRGARERWLSFGLVILTDPLFR